MQTSLPPASSLFDLYTVWSGGNECPPVYHRWCAYSLVASIIGRRVWIDFGHFVYRPNIYVVLVGPAGIAKSVAIDIALDVGRRVGTVHYGGDAVTYQRLILDIDLTKELAHDTLGQEHEHRSLTLALTEMASFVNFQNTDMLKFLCRMFDAGNAPFLYRTKNSGEVTLTNYCLNLLGACTPGDIPYIFGQHAIGSGLASRVLFVYGDIPGPPQPRPRLTREQISAREALVARCATISSLVGEMTLSPEAGAAYDQWYTERMQRTHPDPRLSAFYSRLRVNVPKLAMLQALSQNRMVVEAADLAVALRDMQALERGLRRAFSAVGTNKQSPTLESMLQQVRLAHPRPVPLRVLVDGHLHLMELPQIKSALDGLVVSKRLVRGASEGQEAFTLGATELEGAI